MAEEKKVLLEITDLTEEGQGVARQEGKVVFVADALPGEAVLAEITRVGKKFDQARAVEIRQASSERQTPFCSHYGVCGGCSLQHISYEAGLLAKARWVRGSLGKIAGVEIPLPQVLGLPENRGYRNKAVFHGFREEGQWHLGYYRKGGRQPLAIGECPLLPPLFLQMKKVLEGIFQRTGCQPEEAILRLGGGEVAVTLKGCSRIEAEQVEPLLQASFPQAFLAQGEKGERLLTMTLGDHSFMVSSASFFQVNKKGAERLYGVIASFLPEDAGDRILYDLYCGVGSIGIYLGSRVREVLGIETVPRAVELARENARAAGIRGTYMAGKVEELLGGIELDPEGIAVIDPPRGGLEPPVLEALLASGISRILYVGCGLGRMARDLGVLSQGGYEVKKVQPVDLFPWTGHVETVVLLSRVKVNTMF